MGVCHGPASWGTPAGVTVCPHGASSVATGTALQRHIHGGHSCSVVLSLGGVCLAPGTRITFQLEKGDRRPGGTGFHCDLGVAAA